MFFEKSASTGEITVRFNIQELLMPTHLTTMKVRDYECDIQGIVNNAVYLNYMEHARHEILSGLNISFAELTARKIHLVVTKVILEYKASLTSGDTFMIDTHIERKGKLQYCFVQKIIRQSDQKLCLKGFVTVVALNEKGRPFLCREVDDYL